jgi:hypothetical protein
VIVLAALVLPVAIAFCGFVVDMANWFEHRRHLQTQADAAALAGAGSFLACPNNDPILQRAEEYGGATWNPQVGDAQGSVHMEINSETFYTQTGYVDDTVVEEPPCEAQMVDVKLTETDLPWWFKLGDVDFLNAHARVEFKEVDTMSGMMPFGVPDVRPLTGRVWFINEETNEILGQAELERRIYANGVAQWDNLDATVDANLPGTGTVHIGARVALSGGTSTTCGQPLVECYDLVSAGGDGDGIVHTRAWTVQTATPTAPQVRHAGLTNLVPDGCPDEYFYEAPADGCNVGVEAQIDLGGGLPADYTINAVVGNKSYRLADGDGDGKWVSVLSDLIHVDPAAGPLNISLEWKAGKNSGTLGMVARTFSASGARSGPIKQATMVVDNASGVSSVEQCDSVDCTHSLAVQLGLQGSFEDHFLDLLTQTDPVMLRFAGGTSGSQNQALDCDPWGEPTGGGTRGFREEIAHGCRPSYAKNEGMACPSSPNDLWGTSSSPDDQGPAWQCVAVETGDRVNQVSTGLNLRIHGDTNPDECEWPNNWNEDLRAPNDEDAGDPRIIHLFLTQFGAFATEGQNTVPVTNFATFYVTGWRGSGGGSNGPCQADPPGDALPDDPVTESGTVVGHFMRYRGPLGNTTGTQPCNFNGPTPCVFALTR